MGNKDAFLALVRAGLWKTEVRLSPYGMIDYKELLRLAEEQSVVGLVTAGMDYVQDVIVPQTDRLLFLGKSMQLEQRNVAMNQFIGKLVEKLRKTGINAVLVKGQGIAECYEKPLWRLCGDVDLLLDEDDYNNAKRLLLPLASNVGKEGDYTKHQGMTIDSWTVELHGNLRCGLSRRIDGVLDDIKQEVFCHNNVRKWQNNKTEVFLPSVDVDAVYVFVHFLKHFYKGGICLRQMCDWCRLLWSYRNTIDISLLEKRLRKMRLFSEWKAFAALAVEIIGMPEDVMPLYDQANKWKRKAQKITQFIVGDDFKNKNDLSYFLKYPYLIRKTISMKRRLGVLINHISIFPLDSFRYFPTIMFHGFRSAAKGE